jgi:RNA polymerase sigma-70 factor (ECF subfamily)
MGTVHPLREQAALRREAGKATDAELLAQVAQGDLSPLGILYDRYHEDVRRFASRASGGAAHADDITHETFLTLAKIADRFDGRGSARPLLLGIAARLTQRHRRNLARWAEALGEIARSALGRSDPTPEGAASLTEDLRRFDEALARLSPEKRIVVLLVEGEGLSGEEVAQALGIPIGTVWTRLHYARADLRKALATPENA